MKQEVVTEGPTVEDAIDAALEELGVQQDAVSYEVLDEPGRKMFGLGSEKPARVRVWLKAEFLADLEAREREQIEDEAEEIPREAAVPAYAREVAEPLTDEELDEIADTAVAAIKRILEGFGIEAHVEEYEGEEGEIILDIDGDDLGILIGRHGRTLDALQTLVAAITNRQLQRRQPVLVDVSGYRYRRKIKLEEIAKRAAERASRQRRPVTLRPMSSYERKVVHMVLRDDRRVVTASEGEEPFRQVVVAPK